MKNVQQKPKIAKKKPQVVKVNFSVMYSGKN